MKQFSIMAMRHALLTHVIFLCVLYDHVPAAETFIVKDGEANAEIVIDLGLPGRLICVSNAIWMAIKIVWLIQQICIN